MPADTDERLRQLEELTEHLLARLSGSPPAPRIVAVKAESGTTYKLQDFDGTSWVDAPLAAGVPSSEREISVFSGGPALAVWRPPANRFELLASTFGVIRFQLPSALTSSTASVASCPVIRVASGANPGATVTVTNEDGWESDAGSQGWAFLDNSTSEWIIFVVPCATGSSSSS